MLNNIEYIKTSIVIIETLEDIEMDDFNENSRFVGFSFRSKLSNGIYAGNSAKKVKFVKIIWNPKQVK